MYLLNSFKISPKNIFDSNKNAAIDLYIFKDVIAKMTGLDIPCNLKDNQLQAFAGGLILQVSIYIQQKYTHEN